MAAQPNYHVYVRIETALQISYLQKLVIDVFTGTIQSVGANKSLALPFIRFR
jgi:hypothetical protein